MEQFNLKKVLPEMDKFFYEIYETKSSKFLEFVFVKYKEQRTIPKRYETKTVEWLIEDFKSRITLKTYISSMANPDWAAGIYYIGEYPDIKFKIYLYKSPTIDTFVNVYNDTAYNSHLMSLIIETSIYHELTHGIFKYFNITSLHVFNEIQTIQEEIQCDTIALQFMKTIYDKNMSDLLPVLFEAYLKYRQTSTELTDAMNIKQKTIKSIRKNQQPYINLYYELFFNDDNLRKYHIFKHSDDYYDGVPLSKNKKFYTDKNNRILLQPNYKKLIAQVKKDNNALKRKEKKNAKTNE